ncbi:MAG: Ubiquinone/menaquinone biosynthesis C-methyltransferase UbiE [Haliscomenobacter sp.]|nr:Ubiquinone/menaquinone biosynthesis C-methyltransferase UbiE [Haliscomenobacter sp.]
MSEHFSPAPKCPKCKENTCWKSFPAGSQHLNLQPPLEVIRCVDCRLLFMHPRPSEKAMELMFAGAVPENLRDYAHQPANYGAVTEQKKQLFKERIQQLSTHFDLTKKNKMLDIGASSGVMVALAADMGWDAYGIEPSLSGVELCKAKKMNVLQSKAEKLPFPDNYFDLVHSHHVFEHLNNPFEAAAEVFRVLKPGGKFFIEVPNQFDNIHFFRYRMMGKVPVRKRGIRSIHHLYFFSKKNLQELLQNAGFNNVQVTDKYLAPRQGITFLGSLLIRVFGNFFLGGYLIQVEGNKQSSYQTNQYE